MLGLKGTLKDRLVQPPLSEHSGLQNGTKFAK